MHRQLARFLHHAWNRSTQVRIERSLVRVPIDLLDAEGNHVVGGFQNHPVPLEINVPLHNGKLQVYRIAQVLYREKEQR